METLLQQRITGISSLLHRSQPFLSKARIDYLMTTILQLQSPISHARIVVFQRTATISLRRFLNLPDVLRLAQTYTDVPVRLVTVNESTSVPEQIRIFNQFDVLITSHGSHLANGIFTTFPALKAVIEINAWTFDSVFYGNFNHWLGYADYVMSNGHTTPGKQKKNCNFNAFSFCFSFSFSSLSSIFFSPFSCVHFPHLALQVLVSPVEAVHSVQLLIFECITAQMKPFHQPDPRILGSIKVNQIKCGKTVINCFKLVSVILQSILRYSNKTWISFSIKLYVTKPQRNELRNSSRQ